MAGILKILAASVGGGLVLGAGIRLGEALVSRSDSSRLTEPKERPESLLDRMERLEAGLAQAAKAQEKQAPPPVRPEHEWQSVFSGIGERIDRQHSDVETIRRQMSTAAQALESVRNLTGGFQEDLHRQLRSEMDRRIAEVEEKLRLRMDAAQKDTVNAMLSVLETRITPRIGRLENDVVSQTAVVSELRDCSLKTEQSIQRLLAVLDRAVTGEPGSARLSVIQGR